MVGVQARRAAVAYATGRGVSQRRACTLMDAARSALGYCSRLSVKDAPALKRMAELSLQYPWLTGIGGSRSFSGATGTP